MNVESTTDPVSDGEVEDFFDRHVDAIADALRNQDYVERMQHFSESVHAFALHSAKAAQAVQAYARGLTSLKCALARIEDAQCDEYRFSVEAARERRRAYGDYHEIRDSHGMMVGIVRFPLH